jgi:hypothetical protein
VQAKFTPLGSPVPGQQGDLIRSLNGEPIYDRDDYIMLAIEHGQTKGYEQPYTIELERDGTRYLYEGHMVFHRGIYGDYFLNSDGSCKTTTAATLSSALEEASFYTKSVLACVDYDLHKWTVQRRRSCEFAVKQLSAAYRQYCPQLTQLSAIVGSIFMPGREAGESIIRKLAFKKASRLAPALIVETAEELTRTIKTLPPGIKVDDNWNSIGQQVGFGMAVGTGVRLITMK